MVDYVSIQATAIRLVAETGRDITLVRYAETPANPAKPWAGPAAPPTGQSTLALKGVFVAPSTERQFGLLALGRGIEFQNLLTYSQQIIIVAQGNNDISIYSQVLDEGIRWGIIGIQILKPGTVELCAFIGVRR